MLAVVLRPRTSSLARSVAAALLALALAGATGACDDGAPAPAPSAAPSPSSTPLADFTTTGLAVTRGDFCSRVAPAAVEQALGGKPARSSGYGNGDRVALAAWVFAPPVTPRWAAELRAAAEKADGCRPVAGAPRFGARSVAVRCREDGRVTTTFHGLFGDAWLSCSLGAGSGAASELLDRTGRWCVTVAQAASA
jgi:hypothetical protein